MGAAWARPTVWKRWSKSWNAKKFPSDPHATDCHNRKGEYEGWSREKRDVYVKRLLPVIADHKINGRISGLHLKSYSAAVEKRSEVAAAFGNPYIASFQSAIVDICDTAAKMQHRRVNFVHENNEYEGDAQNAFLFVQRRFPDMSLSITFGGKHDYVPLQCADVLAFEGNRRLRNTDAPTRKPLEIIDPSARRIGFIDYDERNMPEFISNLCNVYDYIRQHGRLPGKTF